MSKAPFGPIFPLYLDGKGSKGQGKILRGIHKNLRKDKRDVKIPNTVTRRQVLSICLTLISCYLIAQGIVGHFFSGPSVPKQVWEGVLKPLPQTFTESTWPLRLYFIGIGTSLIEKRESENSAGDAKLNSVSLIALLIYYTTHIYIIQLFELFYWFDYNIEFQDMVYKYVWLVKTNSIAVMRARFAKFSQNCAW